MNTHATAPQFEFRVFGQEVGHTAAAMLATYPVDRRDEGTEHYILSATNHQYNLKIREDKLDVKLLRRCHLGLERWQPYLRLAFPVTAAFLHEFCFAWLEIVPLRLRREHYTARQLLQEVVTPSAQLCAVKIDKRRRHYTVAGAQVEITTLCIDDQHQMQTVAVTAAEADTVLHTLAYLRLQTSENTNYLVGLSPYRARVTPVQQKLATPSETFLGAAVPAFATIR